MTDSTDKKEYKKIETTSYSKSGNTLVVSFKAKVSYSIDGDTLKVEIDYRD